MANNQEFEIQFANNSKIKARDVNRLDFPHLINNNLKGEAESIIRSLAFENFNHNENFEMTSEEKQVIKTYQILTQYLMFSQRHLEHKRNVLDDLRSQQFIYNNKADEIIEKQKHKIKALKQKKMDLKSNTISLEYLVKHLNLDKIVENLGKSPKSSKINDENLIQNSVSVGEEKSQHLEKENMGVEDNEEILFEDVRKINLDNSKDFKVKLDEIQKNTNS